jgi:DNA-binding transcriptional MerR regulator
VKPEDDQNFASSDAAALVGVSSATLREWQKCGLVPWQRRDSVGNRLYNKSEIELLRKIKTEREIRHGRTGRRSLVIATSTFTK